MKVRVVLAGIICLFALSIFAGCGGFGGGDTAIPTPSPTVVPERSTKEILEEKIRSLKGDDYGKKFDMTLALYQMRGDTVRGVPEALGRSLLTPVTTGYFIGSSPKQFDEQYFLALICGKEVIMPDPQAFMNRTRAIEVAHDGLSKEEIKKLSPEAYQIGTVTALGEEGKHLAISNPIRKSESHGFIIVELPEGMATTQAQKECSIPRGDYKKARLFSEVLLVGGRDYGLVAHVSNLSEDFKGGTFFLQGDAVPGMFVVAMMDGHPTIIGMAMNSFESSGTVMAVGINTIFPQKSN